MNIRNVFFNRLDQSCIGEAGPFATTPLFHCWHLVKTKQWTFKLFSIPCQDLRISFLLWAKFLLSPFLIIGCWILWVRHSDKNPFSGVIIERSCSEIFQLPVQRSTDLIAKCKNHRNTSIIWTSHKPAVIKKNSTGILTLCNEVNCPKFKTNHISEKGINWFYFGLCPKIWVDFTLSISLYQM